MLGPEFTEGKVPADAGGGAFNKDTVGEQPEIVQVVPSSSPRARDTVPQPVFTQPHTPLPDIGAGVALPPGEYRLIVGVDGGTRLQRADTEVTKPVADVSSEQQEDTVLIEEKTTRTTPAVRVDEIIPGRFHLTRSSGEEAAFDGSESDDKILHHLMEYPDELISSFPGVPPHRLGYVMGKLSRTVNTISGGNTVELVRYARSTGVKGLIFHPTVEVSPPEDPPAEEPTTHTADREMVELTAPSIIREVDPDDPDAVAYYVKTKTGRDVPYVPDDNAKKLVLEHLVTHPDVPADRDTLRALQEEAGRTAPQILTALAKGVNGISRDNTITVEYRGQSNKIVSMTYHSRRTIVSPQEVTSTPEVEQHEPSGIIQPLGDPKLGVYVRGAIGKATETAFVVQPAQREGMALLMQQPDTDIPMSAFKEVIGEDVAYKNMRGLAQRFNRREVPEIISEIRDEVSQKVVAFRYNSQHEKGTA